jgi:hypothetical protein
VEIFIRSSREAIVVVDERTETCGCAALFWVYNNNKYASIDAGL